MLSTELPSPYAKYLVILQLLHALLLRTWTGPGCRTNLPRAGGQPHCHHQLADSGEMFGRYSTPQVAEFMSQTWRYENRITHSELYADEWTFTLCSPADRAAGEADVQPAVRVGQPRRGAHGAVLAPGGGARLHRLRAQEVPAAGGRTPRQPRAHQGRQGDQRGSRQG